MTGYPGNDRASLRRRGRSNVVGVNTNHDVRDFLSSRRARVTPEQAGLPVFGGMRRVAGLRREEVAILAGVSVDYYTRLERGNLGGVSESVLDALASALQLDDAERQHLFNLARAATNPKRAPRRPGMQKVRPGVLQLLEAMSGVPAYVRNGRLDILAANDLGRAVYAPVFASKATPVNTARFAYLDPAAEEFFLDYENVLNDAVAVLRGEAGRNPYDRGLSDMIGELSTRSDDFRVRWAAHNVRLHRTGLKRIHHPTVGDLDLDYEALDLVAEQGLTLITYTAKPNSPTAQALAFLASWTHEAPVGVGTETSQNP
jgi:transcriptional regulator with XRE-family HTH domain